MGAKLVTFRYTDGRLPEGRVVETGPNSVSALLERGEPIEVLEGAEYLEGYEPPEEPAENPSDGWPEGYAYEQAGAYFAVYDPDGQLVESDTESGKWRGEDAAQEAAWRHAGGD